MTANREGYIVILVITLALAMMSPHALADDVVLLSLGGVSYHQGNNDMRNINPGLGIEIRNDAWSLAAGCYENSERALSKYIAAARRLIGNAAIGVEIGGGIVTGYTHRDPTPLLLPLIYWRPGAIEMRGGFIPRGEKRTGTIMMQFAVRTDV